MYTFTEEELEQATLEWFEELGYNIVFAPDIAPDGESPERKDYSEVVLVERLRDSIKRINKNVSDEVVEEAVRKVAITQSPDILVNNRAFHKMITDGIDVEYRDNNGNTKTEKIWLFDFDNINNNDWAVLNQFTIIENKNRRPDVIVFVNGLPLVIFELKSASQEDATIWDAYTQIQNYRKDIPSIFNYNAFLVISDGHNARVGTITANEDRFMMWRTIDGEKVEPDFIPQLEVLLKGMFEKQKFLDILRSFILFDTDGENVKKILASYHQYHAVNKALQNTSMAVSSKGDGRIGVIWHTQGSGKSLSMVFYAGKLILSLNNPTIVVLTDRNDLDDQLFSTFSKCNDVLRQSPKQADTKENLKQLLSVESGGIIFTTIQKFSADEEPLTERKNVIVIADEAHRSQYGFKSKVAQGNLKYGLAKYMRDALPNASFIGFTGTPIENTDKNTPAVFGNYIDVYDMTKAVQDGTTVKIYYESRLAKIDLPQDEIAHIDEEFEEITEQEEHYGKEKLKGKWARLEAIVGAEKRVKLIARDLMKHYETRCEAIEGKAMVVTMSRRIAVDLYNEIVKLKPEWHSEDDNKGSIKVVMTGSASDPGDWQKHVRSKKKREELANRMKDPDDELKIVIVRDMWLTGFDVPCLHTMYIDKPMKGHNLMQAIARVNRVFRDKPGGLVVDYIGIGDSLKHALSSYTDTDRENTGIDTKQAVDVMLEKYQIIKDMFYNFDYTKFFDAKPGDRMGIIAEGVEHILSLKDDGKKRFIKHVIELEKAFSLCATTEEAQNINAEIGYFKAVKSGLVKLETGIKPKTSTQMDLAVNQLISKSVISEEVVDILEGVGLKKPEISILSEEFLEEVKGLRHKNLAFELLQRLLKDKIKVYARRNLVRSRNFSEMLKDAVTKYNNRAIETAQVIKELIELAKEMNKAQQEGQKLGLSESELAFYDALGVNDAAVKILGDEVLKQIARELTEKIKNNLTIDWDKRDSVRAAMRVTIRRLLKKYNYPPDKQEGAVQTVMDQAEKMCEQEVMNYEYENAHDVPVAAEEKEEYKY